MNTPHPDLETLAELADPDLASAANAAPIDPETRAVLDHVAGCETCTADLQALRHVRATLRSLPPVPMPTDVAERLDAALRSAQSSAQTPTVNVVPLQKRSKQPGAGSQSRWRTMPYGAAASIVVILALVVAGVVGLGHSGGGSKGSLKSASEAAPTAAAIGPATIESGTNYTADQLRAQVASVVNKFVPAAAAQFPGLTSLGGSVSAPAAAAAPAASSAAAATTASASAAASAAAPTFAAAAPASSAAPPVAAGVNAAPLQNATTITAPGGPLADPATLAACIATLAGKPEQAVLVDFATFNGAPSTIIVLPDPDVAHKLDIYVEADTQNCANQEFTYAAFLPPSSGP